MNPFPSPEYGRIGHETELAGKEEMGDFQTFGLGKQKRGKGRHIYNDSGCCFLQFIVVTQRLFCPAAGDHAGLGQERSSWKTSGAGVRKCALRFGRLFHRSDATKSFCPALAEDEAGSWLHVLRIVHETEFDRGAITSTDDW